MIPLTQLCRLEDGLFLVVILGMGQNWLAHPDYFRLMGSKWNITNEEDPESIQDESQRILKRC